MIASETISATAVMFPAWRQLFYIVNRTYSGTETTLYASILINPEFLVGDKVLVVVASYNIRICERDGTLHQLVNACLSVDNGFLDMHHALFGSFYLTLCILFGVEVQKRETYVRLWHHYSKRALGREPFCCQLLVEYRHGFTHVVATGGNSIAEVALDGRAFTADHHSSDELPYDMWRLPSMSREAESQPFAIFQDVAAFLFFQFLWDKVQFFTCCLSQLLGYPSSVSCASKIEYHGAKGQALTSSLARARARSIWLQMFSSPNR